MNAVQAMLETHPRELALDKRLLAEAIEALYHCAQQCTACADACLGEESLAPLRQCIRFCLDCADLCQVTGRLVSRQTESQWHLLHDLLEACLTACQLCRAECLTHAQHHEHCRLCAEACDRCAKQCTQLLEAVVQTLEGVER